MTYLKITWARVTNTITTEITKTANAATLRSTDWIFDFRPTTDCGILPPRHRLNCPDQLHISAVHESTGFHR